MDSANDMMVKHYSCHQPTSRLYECGTNLVLTIEMNLQWETYFESKIAGTGVYKQNIQTVEIDISETRWYNDQVLF